MTDPDAAFQQRCLDRMRVVLSQGTTLLYVSHDLATMEATCNRALWLRDGMLVQDDAVRHVLSGYKSWVESFAASAAQGDGPVRIVATRISGADAGLVRSHASMCVEFTVEADRARDIAVYLGVSEGPATPIFVSRAATRLAEGRSTLRCTLEHLPLPMGRFFLWASLHEPGAQSVDLVPWHPARHFDVVGSELVDAPRAVVRLSPVQIDSHWEFSES